MSTHNIYFRQEIKYHMGKKTPFLMRRSKHRPVNVMQVTSKYDDLSFFLFGTTSRNYLPSRKQAFIILTPLNPTFIW